MHDVSAFELEAAVDVEAVEVLWYVSFTFISSWAFNFN